MDAYSVRETFFITKLSASLTLVTSGNLPLVYKKYQYQNARNKISHKAVCVNKNKILVGQKSIGGHT